MSVYFLSGQVRTFNAIFYSSPSCCNVKGITVVTVCAMEQPKFKPKVVRAHSAGLSSSR